MILSCHNLTKSFDDRTILYGASFQVQAGEKLAIVGINGAGKTTLLRMLTGELAPDAGEVQRSRDVRIGYLAQAVHLPPEQTIYQTLKEAKRDIIALEEEIRAAEEEMKVLAGDALMALTDRYADLSARFQAEGGYAWRGAIVGVAKGLGFSEEDFEKRVSSLSGGERTRLLLGRLLLSSPDLILLDEPTNHLDIRSVQWLETWLRNFQGAVIIVSHDRYFLDRIVNRVIEIEHARMRSYTGNYSAYSDKKARERAAAWHAYNNEQREIRRQEEVIRRLKSYNREKSVKRAESREKLLEKMEKTERPREVRDEMRIVLSPRTESGEDVLQAEGLSKSYDGRTLFSDVSFTVRRGERIAVVGDNGTGKTTLLRILHRLIPPDAGKVRYGVKVQIGYYDQEQQLLSDDKTLFMEIADSFPTLDNTTIRSTLAAFLFTGDAVYKQVKELSGGERGKLALAKLMLSEANFLLLDEPTNHLDITSREVLESALTGYTGTVLFVSHDRYFINRCATRVLDLTNGMLINYIGNYDYYIAHRPDRMRFVLHTPYQEPSPGEEAQDFPAPAPQAGKKAREKTPQTESESLRDWKAQKELLSMQRRQAAALQKCEEMITALEARNDEINRQFSLAEIASNAVKLKWLSDEQAEIAAQLDELYRQWEALS